MGKQELEKPLELRRSLGLIGGYAPPLKIARGARGQLRQSLAQNLFGDGWRHLIRRWRPVDYAVGLGLRGEIFGIEIESGWRSHIVDLSFAIRYDAGACALRSSTSQ